MKYTKKERSWILYDWANSGYSIVITTAILPIYFKAVAAGAGVSGPNATAYWGYANSIGTLVVSVLAPLLGALADYQFYKKRMFNVATAIGILMTFALAFVPSDSWAMLLGVYVLSTIGFAATNIFYDGFLVDVTTNERMDKVSSAGYGFGYLGGVIPFVLFMILKLTNGFGVFDTTSVVKVGFIITALWWLVFSIPFFKNIEQVHYLPTVKQPVRTSLKRVWKTMGHIWSQKPIVWFLIAYFFYIDGVDTIFKMASVFGVDMGVTSNELIIVLLVVQLVAFPATLCYGWLAKKTNTKVAILLAIATYCFICIYAYFMTSLIDFWIIAILVGTAQGGLQALSRSYFGRIIPKDNANEFFGFYNIFGKFSAILGPIIFGIITQLSGHSRYGVGGLLILFLLGGIIFILVPQSADAD